MVKERRGLQCTFYKKQGRKSQTTNPNRTISSRVADFTNSLKQACNTPATCPTITGRITVREGEQFAYITWAVHGTAKDMLRAQRANTTSSLRWKADARATAMQLAETNAFRLSRLQSLSVVCEFESAGKPQRALVSFW